MMSYDLLGKDMWSEEGFVTTPENNSGSPAEPPEPGKIVSAADLFGSPGDAEGVQDGGPNPPAE